MDYTPYYAEAVIAINENIRNGEEFFLKELFPLYRWNELTNYQKRDFGRFFSSKVSDNNIPSVIKCESVKGPTKYRKQ